MPGTPRCCCVRVCQSPVLILGFRRAARLSLLFRNEPLQEAGERMRVMYERVAGIDVHKDMIKVGFRTPGHRAWTRTSEVLEYRTFYGVLQMMPVICASGTSPMW